METTLQQANTYLLGLMKGVGAKTMAKLRSIGIFTVEDLLFYLPIRYEDRTHIDKIIDTKNNGMHQLHLTIKHTNISYGHKRQLICTAYDDTGEVQLKFFNFYKNQYQSLNNTGGRLICYGRISEFGGNKQILHPKIKHLTEHQQPECEEYLTPIYKAAAGINQALWQKMISQALNLLPSMQLLNELIPSNILERFKLVELATAIAWVHRPPKNVERNLLHNKMHPCWQRLAFEELLAQHLQMERKRLERQQYKANQFSCENNLITELKNNLPFKLTTAQLRTIAEIHTDCAKPQPMLRLVQGDVGSGKTLVAIMAMLQAVASGYQAAMMVPTELLAEQHIKTLEKYLQPLGINVAALLGKFTAKQREPILAGLANGEISIAVGTHALFQDAVVFKKLALIVIDEQHRFGVHQRMSFWQKGNSNDKVAHQLIMTATPIPRTLAMTAYANMDTSIIDVLPAGRKPIATTVLCNNKREELITRVKKLLAANAQAYWLCTRIDSGDEAISDASILHEELIASLRPYRVGLIHGKLLPQEKTNVMQEFIAGKINVLVATTVIEVGVDVPNAQLIVIENAELLGLAQLHQLRGRVGRSDKQSYCILLYQDKLSNNGKQRLETMRTISDGFAIAEKDLAMRGSGEILGTQQSGDISYRFVDLARDTNLSEAAYLAAKMMIQEEIKIQDALINRWSPVNCDYKSV
jgi:ATP-dependent DNA helicase RecG